MVLQHPWCGAGWGDFTYHHALNKSFGNQELAKDPHNIVAAFASQTGILGGSLIMGLLIFALIIAIKRFKRSADWEDLALSTGLTAYTLHMLMDLDWQVPALMAVYSLLTFAAVRTEESPPQLQTAASSRLLPVFMLLLALLAAVGGIHWSIADQTHSNFLKAAGQEAGVPNFAGSRFAVDQAARQALRFAPYSHSILNSLGNDRLRRYDLQGAEEYYLQALKIVPRSHAIHQSLSKVYDLQGNKEKAQKYQQRADELFPYKKFFLDKQKGIKNE